MIVIGTVAGPEDRELLEWAEHWKKRGHLLIIVQGKPEWLNSAIAKELLIIAPGATIIPMLPVGNPDVHWNSLMAIASTLPDYEGLLIKGTDEYMNDICWHKLQKLVKADLGGAVFWIFRKNFYDGRHFESMPGDFQPTFVRGIPMTFSVGFHTYPSPSCPIDTIRYLPENIYVEHRRSLGRVIAVNRQRDQIARPNESAVQNRFLDRLKAACTAAGVKWPEASNEKA